MSKPSKNGDQLPAVGSTVRYHANVESMAQYEGVYTVDAIIPGDERPVVIRNGARVMHVRASSVTVEGTPAKKGESRPGGSVLTPQVGMLVWYRGPLRQHQGVAQVSVIEGDRLTLQAGVAGTGDVFYGPRDSIGRVTIAVCHDVAARAVCGYCQSELESGKPDSRCSRCHQRVVGVTNPYSGIDTVPADCKLPRVSWAVAQLTTSH